MLHWVVEGARKSRLLDDVWVATDDARIADSLAPLAVRVVMTDEGLASGTDRVWAAVAAESAEIIVNIQGDEPLISAAHIDPLVAVLLENAELEMATLGTRIDAEELSSSHVVKVIVDKYARALYFSRFPIPYSRLGIAELPVPGLFKHVGLYAYRREFLERFCQSGAVALELAEGLEQLRALHLGAKIQVAHTDQVCCGVDTPEDVEKIERLLKVGKNHGQ